MDLVSALENPQAQVCAPATSSPGCHGLTLQGRGLWSHLTAELLFWVSLSPYCLFLVLKLQFHSPEQSEVRLLMKIQNHNTPWYYGLPRGPLMVQELVLLSKTSSLAGVNQFSISLASVRLC